MKLTKEAMERNCRAAGMVPEKRETVQGYDIFIADGFSGTPHYHFARFGVEKGEFPFGCFATLWWIGKDEELDIGRPILFDAFHNPEMDKDTKRIGRINRAMQDAVDFLRRRKRIQLNG